MKQWIFIICSILCINNSYAISLDTVVAEVNDAIITQSELDKNIADTKMQLKARHIELPSEQTLKKQVLQHLIDIKLQLQFAKNNNIHLDDDELNEIIKNIALQNKISVDQMRQELAKVGINWNDYKETLRKEVLITRIQQQVVGREIHITDSEVNSYLKDFVAAQDGQKKYHLMNILVPLSDAPSPQEVALAKEKANKLLKLIQRGDDFAKLAVMESSDEYALEGGDLGERYLAELPDVFSSAVKTMQVNQVKGPIRTGNGWQLIKLVGVNDQELHHQITKTHVKHILIKSGPQMTEDQAEHSIQNLHRQIQSGKEFEVLAKQYSVDAATAVKGGDMGWVVSNELVPQFAEVMDKLPVNGISVPVKSPFGWHIIKVEERKEEDDSAAFQRQKVRAMLQQKRFAEAIKNWQQRLRAQAFVNILDKSLQS
jgi:peptidyl-prolyl cis-trans isomerase SurA